MSKTNALKKADFFLAELKTLWQPSDSRIEHFEKVVQTCKKQMRAVFPTVSWDTHIWEISDYEPTQSARQATHASNILFTRKSGAAKKARVAIEDQVPFPRPFVDLTKSMVVLKHLSNPVTHGAHMVLIRAFRYLYEVFEGHGLQHIHQLNGIHFDHACQEAIKQGEKSSTLYRTGEQLSYIAASHRPMKAQFHTQKEWSIPHRNKKNLWVFAFH